MRPAPLVCLLTGPRSSWPLSSGLLKHSTHGIRHKRRLRLAQDQAFKFFPNITFICVEVLSGGFARGGTYKEFSTLWAQDPAVMSTTGLIPEVTLQSLNCESEYVTALDTAIIPDAVYMSERRRRLEELRCKCSSEEYEMEKSREHWTEVGGASSEEERLRVANRQHFQCLEEKYRSSRPLHFRPLRPQSKFFRDWGDALVVGKKIAEGGQAEIFEATLQWKYGKEKCVLKVFKSGYSLADLERQWSSTPGNNSLAVHEWKFCFMRHGTLLKDGRFAFVMDRYWGDLRKLIDLHMKNNHRQGPPFQFPIRIMLQIAQGMKQLHQEGILHRDLKASNVLLGCAKKSACDWKMVKGIRTFCNEDFQCCIADFESSVGVQGTAFWRAPEVLRALRNGDSNPDIWTKKVDVYSYAMTCYEVLTGCLPLGHLAKHDYDAVIRGERPLLPDFVDDHIQDLLRRCWHPEPSLRPTFEHIVKKLEWRPGFWRPQSKRKPCEGWPIQELHSGSKHR